MAELLRHSLKDSGCAVLEPNLIREEGSYMFEDQTRKTIGIIGAMKSEIDALKEKIENPKSLTVSGIEYIYGALYNVNVVAAQSGVGKVFAAMCAQTMILTFHPDQLLNIGIGGALSPGLEIGDIAIANQLVQHDMDTSAVGDPVGLISGINIVYLPCTERITAELETCAGELGLHYETGVIASGDCFVSSSKQKRRIVELFSGIVSEMEGAAIGQVCYVNGVDYCVVRAISDTADENVENDYFVSKEKACAAAQALTDAYLKKCVNDSEDFKC